MSSRASAAAYCDLAAAEFLTLARYIRASNTWAPPSDKLPMTLSAAVHSAIQFRKSLERGITSDPNQLEIPQ